MKKIISPLTVLIITTLLSGGCKKYLDINDNPNAATQPPLKGLLANATYYTAFNTFYVSDYTSYYTQYLASPNPGSSTDTYDNVDASDAWDPIYAVMTSLYDMKQAAIAGGRIHYIGAADVLLAYNLSMSSNLWGNIPWSQAFLGIQNPTPKYDDQKSLYDTCIALLNQGIADLQATDPTSELDAASDFIHGGDPKAWIKTAHVLKARLLNQVSKTAAYNATNILTELSAGYTGNGDDAQVSHFVANVNNNPWDSVALSNAGLNLGGWLSTHFVNATNGNTFGIFDPRLPLITDTTRYGDYRGTINGQGRIGTGTNHDECYLNQDNWYSSPTAPVQLITYAEAAFIQAEALFRNGDKPNAYNAYLAGIKTHMQKLGVADTAIQRYTTDPGVAVGAGNITLALIMKEKYVACFLSPVTWDDMRRFDYVYTAFSMPAGAQLGTFIRRMNYPTDELSRNGKNAPAVQLTDHLWWDQ
jgi:hypothetical protein